MGGPNSGCKGSNGTCRRARLLATASQPRPPLEVLPVIKGEPHIRDKKEGKQGNVRSPFLFPSLHPPHQPLFEPHEDGRPPHKWEIRPLTHQGRLKAQGSTSLVISPSGIILKTMRKEKIGLSQKAGEERRVCLLSLTSIRRSFRHQRPSKMKSWSAAPVLLSLGCPPLPPRTLLRP